MACLDNQITIEAKDGNWWAPTQVEFCKKYYKEDLIVADEYLINRANLDRRPFVMYYDDLKKAFDTIFRDHLMTIFATHYSLDINIIEIIRQIYLDVHG